MAAFVVHHFKKRISKFLLFSPHFAKIRQQQVSSNQIVEILKQENVAKLVKVQGWIQNLRKQKKVIFADLIDGSTAKHLQLVINTEQCRDHLLTTGSAVEVTGKLVPSIHPLQKIELHTDDIKIVSRCETLPFNNEVQNKQDRDYIRKYLHLRSKTKFIRSILKIRSEMLHAVHQFFKENDFIQIHTPILSSNDCEGGGNVFTVTVPSYEKTEGKNFFDESVYLSVSGQLHLEAVVGGLSRVYCFNPAFRAENGVTRRHLSEFYMIEAEIAFLDNLDALMDVIENLVKTVLRNIMDSCDENLSVHQPENHKEMLKNLVSTPFIRLTFSEAFDCLVKHQDELPEKPDQEHGELSRDQEILLVKIHNQIPVFVTDYPSSNRPFYMKRCTENPNHVKSVDLVAPFVGELCGGGLRETSSALLEEALYKAGQCHQLKWYLDLRKYGDAPHAGFGLGFERLLMLATGLNNIRDVMPFPRWAHNCKL